MKPKGVWAVLFVAVVYGVAGLLFGRLAGQAASAQVRDGWRWAAWIVSAAAFGAHIVYCQLRLRYSARVTALYVASATGLGAFALAVAANVHALTTSAHAPPVLLMLSLAIWPIMTALPAFAVALICALLLARARQTVLERT